MKGVLHEVYDFRRKMLRRFRHLWLNIVLWRLQFGSLSAEEQKASKWCIETYQMLGADCTERNIDCFESVDYDVSSQKKRVSLFSGV